MDTEIVSSRSISGHRRRAVTALALGLASVPGCALLPEGMPQETGANVHGVWLPWSAAISIAVVGFLLTLALGAFLFFRGWNRIVITLMTLYWIAATGWLSMDVQARAQAELAKDGRIDGWFQFISAAVKNDPLVIIGAILTALSLVLSFTLFRKTTVDRKELVRLLLTREITVDEIMEGLIERCGVWIVDRNALWHHVIHHSPAEDCGWWGKIGRMCMLFQFAWPSRYRERIQALRSRLDFHIEQYQKNGGPFPSEVGSFSGNRPDVRRAAAEQLHKLIAELPPAPDESAS